MNRTRSYGFTLIELVVTMAIVAILAAIAFPAYQDHVRKARRADAKAALVELAQWMERNFTEALRYDQDSNGNAISSATLPFKKVPREGSNEYYGLTLSSLTATTFTLSATPKNAQVHDKCATLTLTNTGLKGTTSGLNVEKCW